MFKETDIAWLAGLMEGEGSFFPEKKSGRTKRIATMVVTMSDPDVIQRVADMMDTKMNGPMWSNKSTIPLYRARVRGTKALALMQLILPYMGERRSAKILELMEMFK